jgi:hypothetical protein
MMDLTKILEKQFHNAWFEQKKIGVQLPALSELYPERLIEGYEMKSN